MITILKESDNTKVKTKVKFTGDCRTYEVYQADYLEFEMILPEYDLAPIFNRENANYEYVVDQPITYSDIDISDCEFEDLTDGESGKLVMVATINSERPLSEEDLAILADNALMELADEIKIHVTGVDTGFEEFVDYSRDDYRGERTVKIEIDDTDFISSFIKNVKAERL